MKYLTQVKLNISIAFHFIEHKGQFDRSTWVCLMVHHAPIQERSGWKGENSSQQFQKVGTDWLIIYQLHVMGHLFDLSKSSFHHLSKEYKNNT